MNEVKLIKKLVNNSLNFFSFIFKFWVALDNFEFIKMDAAFYRGTSTDQDIRFTDKERKLLKQMRFEQVLDIKVGERVPVKLE